jgi:hypothetical protein
VAAVQRRNPTPYRKKWVRTRSYLTLATGRRACIFKPKVDVMVEKRQRDANIYLRNALFTLCKLPFRLYPLSKLFTGSYFIHRCSVDSRKTPVLQNMQIYHPLLRPHRLLCLIDCTVRSIVYNSTAKQGRLNKNTKWTAAQDPFTLWTSNRWTSIPSCDFPPYISEFHKNILRILLLQVSSNYAIYH